MLDCCILALSRHNTGRKHYLSGRSILPVAQHQSDLTPAREPVKQPKIRIDRYPCPSQTLRTATTHEGRKHLPCRAGLLLV